MKPIKQESVDKAFSLKAARDITVHRRSEHEWYFTFEADDPVLEQPVRYALLTQRGELRTWADPRLLFKFLMTRYNVTVGTFSLIEESPDEKCDPPQSG